jgi:hypothetical protein
MTPAFQNLPQLSVSCVSTNLPAAHSQKLPNRRLMKPIAPELALPAQRHLPGLNARPAEHFLDAIATFDDPPIDNASASNHLGWNYGLRLINEGFYWEAHEVLEPVWWQAAANSAARHLVQTTIHLTNAALKLRLNRTRAASKLAKRATEGCERAFVASPERLLGLDQAQLVAAISAIKRGEHRIRLATDYAL